jgi:nitrile hydratase beta subunit
MNGAQDVGGMQCFGAVEPEPDEPVFHAEWERRAFALTVAMGFTGAWNIDMARAARESLPPRQYYAKTYYEIWLAGLEKLLAERGLVTPAEIAQGEVLTPPQPVARVLTAADAPVALARGTNYARVPTAPPHFAEGARIRARVMHPPTHTRLPRYVRGHAGTVEHVRGCHVFPDSAALGAGENPQWLYTVRFDARELWGADADPTVSVSVDAWEPYLDAA